MDAKSIGLAVASGVAVVALLGAAYLVNDLIDARATVKNLQAKAAKLDKARNADAAANNEQRNKHQEAQEDARQKLQAIDSIPQALPDSDYLDALRHSSGLLQQTANGGADNPAAKSAAGLPATPATGGTPAN